MKVIDPGHRYELAHLDGDGTAILTFVKRMGEKYPGNEDAHEGTTIQEVLRALLERMWYVHRQAPCGKNLEILKHLEQAMWKLEERAAHANGMQLGQALVERDRRSPGMYDGNIEHWPTCPTCGHWVCHHPGHP